MTSWNAYDINGYTYYTHAKDSKYVNQNSGVRIEALDGFGRKIQYFGIIEEIWKLDYGRDIMVALFRCCWIKQHQLNEIGLRVLDLENLGYQDDPWVLAAQVFYMPDPQSNVPPKKKTKHVVASGKLHIIGVDGVDDLKLTITTIRCHYSQTFLGRSVLWKRTYPKIYCHGNENVSNGKSL